jgi:hypothetical protein
VKAGLVVDDKIVFEDGSILEIRIWSVLRPVPPTIHGYKYSLFFGHPGKRLVGFDNERGKGDHKHILGNETAYAFVSIEQLLRDFRGAVETVKGTSL